jgi:hypothetical protein
MFAQHFRSFSFRNSKIVYYLVYFSSLFNSLDEAIPCSNMLPSTVEEPGHHDDD